MTVHAAARKASERLAALKPSATVEMTDRVRQARAAGRKVIGLSSGDPNITTDPRIVAAAERALARGDTHYATPAGQPERLTKFTSVASVIGVTEFTGAALLVNAREFQPVPILITVALTYLVLCYGLSLAGRLLYRRLAVRD
jgi:hypothetical protein